MDEIRLDQLKNWAEPRWTNYVSRLINQSMS